MSFLSAVASGFIKGAFHGATRFYDNRRDDHGTHSYDQVDARVSSAAKSRGALIRGPNMSVPRAGVGRSHDVSDRTGGTEHAQTLTNEMQEALHPTPPEPYRPDSFDRYGNEFKRSDPPVGREEPRGNPFPDIHTSSRYGNYHNPNAMDSSRIGNPFSPDAPEPPGWNDVQDARECGLEHYTKLHKIASMIRAAPWRR